MRRPLPIALVLLLAPVAHATGLPVVEAMPGCAHEKLGSVAV